VNALHAEGVFGIERVVQRPDFLVEVADQVPAEIRGLVELLQRVRRIDAAADNLRVEPLELIRV